MLFPTSVRIKYTSTLVRSHFGSNELLTHFTFDTDDPGQAYAYFQVLRGFRSSNQPDAKLFSLREFLLRGESRNLVSNTNRLCAHIEKILDNYSILRSARCYCTMQDSTIVLDIILV